MTYDTPAINAQVQALYQENLKRAGEPEGVAYYTTLVTNGVTLAEVDQMMEASPEFAALNGGTGIGVSSNARLWVIAGALGLLVWIVVRRSKK